MLIADEAHNLGAPLSQRALGPEYPYRLALSATMDRHHDIEGTKALRDFFGKPCIEYSLQKAIEEGYLTKYEYHPIFVTLSDEERDAYRELTQKIGFLLNQSKERSISQQAERLLIERSRLIATARAKVPALVDALRPFANESNILVYCGAGSGLTLELESVSPDQNTPRQIETVVAALARRSQNGLGMKVSTFTGQKSPEEREQIKKMFTEGRTQALIAIRCLDEGVNIPGIQKAFILASSTNPKEYIQRRGRVLRLAEGKRKAEIYDFITLPWSIEEFDSITPQEIIIFRRLVANELLRYKEFSQLSTNDAFNSFNFLLLCNKFQLDTSNPNLLQTDDQYSAL